MNEIKCPKCGTLFQISETNYESIVKQIRDKEFEKEITLRENQHKIDKENAIELTKVNTEKKLTEELNKKIFTVIFNTSCPCGICFLFQNILFPESKTGAIPTNFKVEESLNTPKLYKCLSVLEIRKSVRI